MLLQSLTRDSREHYASHVNMFCLRSHRKFEARSWPELQRSMGDSAFIQWKILGTQVLNSVRGSLLAKSVVELGKTR